MKDRARRSLLLVLAALAAVLAVAFVLRAITMAMAPPDASPAGWMTPRYMHRVLHLPPDRLAEILRIEPGSAPRRSLSDIARDSGRPLDDILLEIEAEIAAQGARK